MDFTVALSESEVEAIDFFRGLGIGGAVTEDGEVVNVTREEFLQWKTNSIMYFLMEEYRARKAEELQSSLSEFTQSEIDEIIEDAKSKKGKKVK